MKSILVIFAFFLLSSLVSFDPLEITWTISLIVAIIVGVYELLARLIPSFGNWTFIGRVIDILKIVSDYLDKRKKKRN